MGKKRLTEEQIIGVLKEPAVESRRQSCAASTASRRPPTTTGRRSTQA